MTIWQDDMGLGQSVNGGGLEWNVEWDARVGSDANFVVYDPYQDIAENSGEGDGIPDDIVLEDILDLSELEEIDFSILVRKFPLGTGVNGVYAGAMTLGANAAEFRTCDSTKSTTVGILDAHGTGNSNMNGDTDNLIPTYNGQWGTGERYPGIYVRPPY